MVAKAVLVVCAQALLIQCISGQCLGAGFPASAAPLIAPLAAPLAPLAAPLATPCSAWPAAGLAASNGPGLAVTSASPIPPIGVSVSSDNAYEGPLAVAGAVPFLGSVGLEGALPTAGAGAIAYNCGSGAVGITAEDIAGPLGYPALAAGPLGLAGPLGAPLGGYGCGYRGIF